MFIYVCVCVYIYVYIYIYIYILPQLKRNPMKINIKILKTKKEEFRRKYTQILGLIASGGEILFSNLSGLSKMYTHIIFTCNQKFT